MAGDAPGRFVPTDVAYYYCTNPDCNAGPWESKPDAWRHVQEEQDGEHAITAEPNDRA